jgi:hypothetical protein
MSGTEGACLFVSKWITLKQSIFSDATTKKVHTPKTMHEATFQHCAAAVIAFINAARFNLQVAICWFTHPSIFQALLEACSRGVSVKIMINFDQVNFRAEGLNFKALENSGAAVLAYTGQALLHHKCAVADDCRVLTGSYNWTRSEQCDHVVIIQDSLLALQFARALEDTVGRCKTLAQLQNTPPKQVIFAQLHQPTLWDIQALRKNIVSGAKTWLVVAKSKSEWHAWTTEQRHYFRVNIGKNTWDNEGTWDESNFRRWRLTTTNRPTAKRLITRYCLRVQMGDVFTAVDPSGLLLGTGIVHSHPELTAEIPPLFSRAVLWITLPQTSSEHIQLPKLPKGVIQPYRGSALALLATLERASSS